MEQKIKLTSDKTVEELFKEYSKKFPTTSGSYPEPEEVFIAGYNECEEQMTEKIKEVAEHFWNICDDRDVFEVKWKQFLKEQDERNR